MLHRALVAGVVTLAFAASARMMKGVSRSGALAGAVVAYALYLGLGAGAFITLIAVFLLTLLATRAGYSRKQRMGTAERGDGRTGSQVLANLGVAGAASLAYLIIPDRVLALACVAALAEAAADTVSSETGQAATSTARLITTWQQVPAGTDGGISLPGSVAGVVSALAVAVVAGGVKLVPWPSILIATAAAIFGMFFDSALGAWLERRSLLNNDSVNLLSTLSAAAIAAAGALLSR